MDCSRSVTRRATCPNCVGTPVAVAMTSLSIEGALTLERREARATGGGRGLAAAGDGGDYRLGDGYHDGWPAAGGSVKGARCAAAAAGTPRRGHLLAVGAGCAVHRAALGSARKKATDGARPVRGRRGI